MLLATCFNQFLLPCFDKNDSSMCLFCDVLCWKLRFASCDAMFSSLIGISIKAKGEVNILVSLVF
jgi:hypothetical protein